VILAKARLLYPRLEDLHCGSNLRQV